MAFLDLHVVLQSGGASEPLCAVGALLRCVVGLRIFRVPVRVLSALVELEGLGRVEHVVAPRALQHGR